MNQDVNPLMYGGPDKEETPKRSGKNHNPKSVTLLTVILVFIAVGILIAIVSMINSGYTVKNIIVNGSSPYSEEDIRGLVQEYCKEKNSLSFFRVNADELEKMYYEKMPYLKKADVEKKYPDTVVVTIEGESAEYIFEAHGKYYVLNREMKVLEEIAGIPEDTGLVVLSFGTPKEITLGKKIVFEENNLMDEESFLKLNQALQDAGMESDVKSIKADNKFELSMVLRSGVDVYIGSIKDVGEKIRGLKKWLDENPDEISDNLNADISILKKIVISRD